MSWFKRFGRDLKAAFLAWNADDALRLSAALAYYTVFSIAPLILIIVAVAGLAFGPEAIRGELFGQIRGLMGREGAKAVEEIIANAGRPKAGLLATITGSVVLLVGATAVFAELKASLNKIWSVSPRVQSGVWSFLRARLLSFAMVLTIGFLLLVSLIVNALLSLGSKYFQSHFSISLAGLDGAYSLISWAMIAVLFALIFKWLPDKSPSWKAVRSGAWLTALLFTIGKYLIGLYLGQSAVASAFGASASVVIILIWAYYSAAILLFGAEFIKIRCRGESGR